MTIGAAAAAANPWLMTATGNATGAVPLATAGQYYSSLPADTMLQTNGVSQHDVMYTTAAGAHYQAVELGDAQLVSTRTNEVDPRDLFPLMCQVVWTKVQGLQIYLQD
jgi:hypothetical protein